MHRPAPLNLAVLATTQRISRRQQLFARLTAALFLAAAALTLFIATPARAQYPDKPVKVIVPFPPGGGGDVLARLVLQRVAKELAQPMVFENLSGAGGNVGSQAAVKAAP